MPEIDVRVEVEANTSNGGFQCYQSLTIQILTLKWLNEFTENAGLKRYAQFLYTLSVDLFL